MTQEYKDTFETCPECESGTIVLYPDLVKRCRYCGEVKVVTPRVAAGKKTNG